MKNNTANSISLRRSLKALAMMGALAGASIGFAAEPLSPWSNVIDLNGRYMAPSPGNSGFDGLARVNTMPAADNVLEVSNGWYAQENTFTPFSDAFKRPMPQAVDMRGHAFSADVDLCAPANWAGTTGDEAFVVGYGANFGSGGPVGVVVEARYVWPTANDPHAQFRLRTSVATGPWMDAGSYGAMQVEGAYTVRVDVNSSGGMATMTVTPKPLLYPPPTGVYNDLVDSQSANVSGLAPFVAGFWSNGTPGTVRGAARLVRMVTDAGDPMTMWLKSTAPYITSADGQADGATAPLMTEFHLGLSNVSNLYRGYQASGIYRGSVYGYYIHPMIMDPTAIQDQSYTNPIVGPFPYAKSPYVFNTTLWSSIIGGPYGFANYRVSAGSAPATPSLNVDAELAGLPVGGVNPEPINHTAGGGIWVELVNNDPDGILGPTGVALENGQVLATPVRGSDVVLVDEVKPVAFIDGGFVRQGSLNLIPFGGPDVTAYQGNVDISFFSRDLGNYMAATGSGLAKLPEATLEYLTDNGWVPDRNLVVFPAWDNMFNARWVIDNNTHCGTYRLRLRAVDRVGLVSPDFVTRSWYVQTLKSITVNVNLQGLVGNPNANNQRLLKFILGSAPGTVVPPGGTTAPRTVIEKLVRFNNGQATLVFAPTDIPHCDARNLVVWIKDRQHTLAGATPSLNGIVGSEYNVTLNLKAGDVTEDNVVNFTDYALFVADYGKVAPRDMTSFSWYRNCDFNGSGQVDFTDWVLFYPNYGLVGPAEPGSYVRSRPGGGNNLSDPNLTRLTVKQLIGLGISDAGKWDMNWDGWVDRAELDKVLKSKMR